MKSIRRELRDDKLMLAVEDIMCDQCIISPEINISLEHNQNNYLTIPGRKLWLQNILYLLRNRLVPALVAFLIKSIAKALAPLQRIPLSLPSGVVRVRQRRKVTTQLAITCTSEDQQDVKKKETEEPERCVDCTVLHEPKEPPVADIIFVHGLHGGLDRTWTQGTWRVKNPKLKNLTPVRRHSTGDLYVPLQEPEPQEGKLKRTLSRIYTIPAKIARSTTSDSREQSRIREILEKGLESEEDVENFSRCWPKDWLPEDCPGVRILAINYTTDVLWRPLWQKRKARTNIIERSKEMEEELLSLGVGKRPIVWVGHSKGGLFIKQIILNGWSADLHNQDLRNIFTQTRAIMFYSVPHKGSPIAEMKFPLFRRSIELLEVQRNEFVLNLHHRFLEIFQSENNNKPEIFSFIDTENTPVGYMSFKFIAYESADPDIGVKCDVPLDHREICKPAGRDCFLYLELVKLIRRSIFSQTA